MPVKAIEDRIQKDEKTMGRRWEIIEEYESKIAHYSQKIETQKRLIEQDKLRIMDLHQAKKLLKGGVVD